MRLKRDFFTRDTRLVAKDLLGKILVLKRDNIEYRGKIVEAEAYIGNNDDAAHFHKGITERTRAIAEEGGHIYIYTIYGMYQCFNIVAEKAGVLGGSLIRALEPIQGLEEMYKNRYKNPYDNPKKRELINLTNGPAKLVMAFGISKKEFYGADLVTDSRIWVEEGDILTENDIVTTTRVNIDYAKSKDYPFRFYIRQNPYVSKK